MSVNELERVKSDLEIIKEATGLELPFGWDSVLVSLILFPATGAWWLLYWFISDRPSRFWMAVPIAVLAVAMGHLRFKYRQSTGRSAVKRREYGLQFYEMIVVGAIAAGYFLWARQAGLNIAYVGGGIILIGGALDIFRAFGTRGRLYYLGLDIPVMLFGFSLLIWTTPAIIIINGSIAFFLGGLAMGAIQAYQLKQVKLTNAN